jgi:transcriptional activator
VVEERIELELTAGGGTDPIAELRDLIAEHPLRERLRGLLMLALYQAGRQGDALAAYQEARRRLDDELGVEPSAPLQRLHQQILAADPQLAAPPAAEVAPDDETAAGSRRPLPAQLPHRIPDFTGRDAELGRLDALLTADRGDSGTSVVITAITGTAGVGKTALAVHWAHQVSDRFPDGQLYVNLRGFDPGGAATDPAEAEQAAADWTGAWQADQPMPPVLTYWSAPGFVQIYDERRPGQGGTYTFEDTLADLYLACTGGPVTAAAVRRRLDLALPADGIGEVFGEFARRGLMFLDGPHALALALPAVKGR